MLSARRGSVYNRDIHVVSFPGKCRPGTTPICKMIFPRRCNTIPFMSSPTDDVLCRTTQGDNWPAHGQTRLTRATVHNAAVTSGRRTNLLTKKAINGHWTLWTTLVV